MIVCALVSAVVTGGRANALAIVATIVVWVAISPDRRRWAMRAQIGTVIAVGVALSLPYWQYRNETGEDGSFRARFREVALNYLDRYGWWEGVGPNRYVPTVGWTDSLTAQGWPVHNIFLLTTVELGLAGAVLFSAMFAMPVVLTLRLLPSPSLRGGYARVLACSLPGLLVITTSGWGMLGDTLSAWMLVTGFCFWKASHSTLDVHGGAGPLLTETRLSSPVERAEIAMSSAPAVPPTRAQGNGNR